MTARQPFVPGPASVPDPRRLVSRTKIATLVGSAVGFGAVAGLVLLGPGGVTSTAPGGDAGGAGAPGQAPAQAPAQQPAATEAGDFFSPPPGFSAQPPLSNGFSGQDAAGGSAGAQGGFGGQGFGAPSGFGGQVPGMRTGGS